jgi:hypothetical protein
MKIPEYKIIYPKIHVYKNAIPDIDNLLNFIKTFEGNDKTIFKPWEKWSVFGLYRYVSFEKDRNESDPGYSFIKNIDDIFLSLTEHYMQFNNIKKEEDWVYCPPHICKYFDYNNFYIPHKNGHMAMVYHTDWQYEKRDRPGLKFEITCNFYLNDEYSGGGLSFSINDEFIDYKPEAGDVIVFPSRPPYFHGVMKNNDAEKYFIRSFWRSNYSGSKEWLNNQKKYGKEEWEKISLEQEKKDGPDGFKYESYRGILD